MSKTDKHIACGHVFDKGYVTVVARYADCSVFKCPGCGGLIDDRPGVHLRSVPLSCDYRRQFYEATSLKEDGHGR